MSYKPDSSQESYVWTIHAVPLKNVACILFCVCFFFSFFLHSESLSVIVIAKTADGSWNGLCSKALHLQWRDPCFTACYVAPLHHRGVSCHTQKCPRKRPGMLWSGHLQPAPGSLQLYGMLRTLALSLFLKHWIVLLTKMQRVMRRRKRKVPKPIV